MHIASEKTRRDMEAAAELRAVGATWETIGEVLGRKPFVLTRWARVYRDDWEQFLRDAGERPLRQCNSRSQTKLRALLHHESSRVRLTTAEKYVRERLAENAAQRPPDPHAELAAFLNEIDQKSDEELHEALDKFFRESGLNAAQGTAP